MPRLKKRTIEIVHRGITYKYNVPVDLTLDDFFKEFYRFDDQNDFDHENLRGITRWRPDNRKKRGTWKNGLWYPSSNWHPKKRELLTKENHKES